MSLDSLNNINDNLIGGVTNGHMESIGLGVDTVVILLAVGGVIFGFFYLFKKYIISILDSGKALRKIKLLAFRIEVIVWLVFSLVTLTQLFTENLLLTAALLVVVGLVGLNFWRDFFPGLLLRVSNKFKIKDPVRYGEYVGTLEKLGRTTIHLKTEEEELIFIPYRRITNEIFIKRQAKGKLMSSKVVLQIGSKDPNLVVDSVSKWIYECPWAITQSTNNATIQPGGLLNVTVYAIDHISLGKVERFIKVRLDTL